MLSSDPRKLAAARVEPSVPEPAPIESHTAEAPPALSSAPSLGALLHSFRRSWKLVVPVALLAAAAAFGIAWLLIPAQYTSTLTFRLSATPNLGNLNSDDNFANVQKSHVAILKSYEVLSDTLVKSRVTETHGISDTPPALAKKLVTHFNDGPEMLAVQLSGESPEAVKAVLDALGDVLPRRMLSADEERVKTTMEQKDKQLNTLAGLLREKRIELAVAEIKAGLNRVGDVAKTKESAERMRDAVLVDLRAVDKDLAGMQADLAIKKRRLERPELGGTDLDVEQALGLVPAYAEVLRDIDAAKRKIAEIARLAAPGSRPGLLRQPRADLEDLERKRDQIVERTRERVDSKAVTELESRLQLAREQRKSLEADLAKWTAEVDRFKTGGLSAPPEVMALRDQVDMLEKEQQRLGEQKASLKGLFPITPRLTRHADAYLPTEKEYARPLKYGLAAAALVFGAFLVGGCLMEARTRRISGSSEVREGLGLKVIGTLPALPSAARKKSVAALSMGGLDSQFGLTEAVDAVRTRLLHAPRVDGARVVMISSAVAGEGKTTLASQLAASLARAWRKTLLIDGDLRNPRAHEQFDLPSGPGLSEALRGEIEFDEAIRPTLLSRLWMMPAGEVDGHALQALTQDGMAEVFERLKEQFDFIIIDTSPVVPVPDALVIGQQADVVILSLMKDISRMPAVYQAQQSLEDLGIRVLGAVMIGEKTESYGKPVPYGPVSGS